METATKATSGPNALKRKRNAKAKTSESSTEPKNIKSEMPVTEAEPVIANLEKPTTAKQAKKRKKTPKAKRNASEPINKSDVDPASDLPTEQKKQKNNKNEETSKDDEEKYPILKNKELIDRFLKVEMNNNQKGRIRQAVRESLMGTSKVLAPEIINNKIESILKTPKDLTDPELRRIRILYNLLKTSLKGESIAPETTEKPEKKKKDVNVKEGEGEKKGKEKKDQPQPKVRGPKRYVVFLGNLPLDINKETITKHFKEMNEHIKDIRIPKKREDKKSAIAYLELTNEPSYEFALSKHHSMLGSKRINVLYSAPKDGKVTKEAAKSKSAKMTALQKSGKLVGSLPLAKKRSQRRLKAKRAQAKLAESA